MSSRRRAYRGRWLAPLALLLGVLAIVLVASAGPARPTIVAPAQATAATSPRHAAVVVGPHDTLSQIALRERTTVAAIVVANPGIDPQALRTGQRLRLTASP